MQSFSCPFILESLHRELGDRKLGSKIPGETVFVRPESQIPEAVKRSAVISLEEHDRPVVAMSRSRVLRAQPRDRGLVVLPVLV